MAISGDVDGHLSGHLSGHLDALPAGVRDHRFHAVRVKAVIGETPEAASLVLDVPADLRPGFAYRAGQFVTFRIPVEGRTLLRSYSMSSAPGIDADLQVTVKRVPGGIVSNWMIDTLAPGDRVDVTYPAGVFCLGSAGGDVVAFAGGSGVTPVMSIVKTALATTPRTVRLLYANRDRDSVIFAGELEALARAHPGRLEVVHHLDVEHGFVDAGTVRSLAPPGPGPEAEYFICGPAPFMDVVEEALLALDVEPASIRIERFTPAEMPAATPSPDKTPSSDKTPSLDTQTAPTRVTITLDGRRATVDHRPGTTILQTARQMGMAPPFSCESGNCATCMARLVDGEVAMRANNALTDEEVADRWILTCQAVPTTPAVGVVYDDEGD